LVASAALGRAPIFGGRINVRVGGASDEHADRIGEFYGNPKTRAFAELLIDAEEDPHLRAVLVGMLRERG